MIQCLCTPARTGDPHFWIGLLLASLHTGFICAVGFLCVKGLNAECADSNRAGALLHPLLRPAALFVAGP